MDDAWLTARWLAEMLDMVQEFGRMAVFKRNLRTGEAHWSPQIQPTFVGVRSSLTSTTTRRPSSTC